MNNGGGGGGSNAPVYIVPWKKASAAPAAGLVLYWFPASSNEYKNSSLKESRASASTAPDSRSKYHD